MYKEPSLLSVFQVGVCVPENCVEADLMMIEELEEKLLQRINFESVENKLHLSFGLLQDDWQRLLLLESKLPPKSPLKTKLVRAFRLLIAALYQAHVPPLNEDQEANIQPSLTDFSPNLFNFTTNENNDVDNEVDANGEALDPSMKDYHSEEETRQVSVIDKEDKIYLVENSTEASETGELVTYPTTKLKPNDDEVSFTPTKEKIQAIDSHKSIDVGSAITTTEAEEESTISEETTMSHQVDKYTIVTVENPDTELGAETLNKTTIYLDTELFNHPTTETYVNPSSQKIFALSSEKGDLNRTFNENVMGFPSKDPIPEDHLGYGTTSGYNINNQDSESTKVYEDKGKENKYFSTTRLLDQESFEPILTTTQYMYTDLYSKEQTNEEVKKYVTDYQTTTGSGEENITTTIIPDDDNSSIVGIIPSSTENYSSKENGPFINHNGYEINQFGSSSPTTSRFYTDKSIDQVTDTEMYGSTPNTNDESTETAIQLTPVKNVKNHEKKRTYIQRIAQSNSITSSDLPPKNKTKVEPQQPNLGLSRKSAPLSSTDSNIRPMNENISTTFPSLNNNYPESESDIAFPESTEDEPVYATADNVETNIYNPNQKGKFSPKAENPLTTSNEKEAPFKVQETVDQEKHMHITTEKIVEVNTKGVDEIQTTTEDSFTSKETQHFIYDEDKLPTKTNEVESTQNYSDMEITDKIDENKKILDSLEEIPNTTDEAIVTQKYGEILDDNQYTTDKVDKHHYIPVKVHDTQESPEEINRHQDTTEKYDVTQKLSNEYEVNYSDIGKTTLEPPNVKDRGQFTDDESELKGNLTDQDFKSEINDIATTLWTTFEPLTKVTTLQPPLKYVTEEISKKDTNPEKIPSSFTPNIETTKSLEIEPSETEAFSTTNLPNNIKADLTTKRFKESFRNFTMTPPKTSTPSTTTEQTNHLTIFSNKTSPFQQFQPKWRKECTNSDDCVKVEHVQYEEPPRSDIQQLGPYPTNLGISKPKLPKVDSREFWDKVKALRRRRPFVLN